MDTATAKGSDSMNDVSINLKDFIDNILPEKIEQGLEMAGQYVENKAKENITEMGAVDTGTLKNSITHEIESGGKSVRIGTNVKYSAPVHDGTPRMEGRPFLQKVADENRTEIIEYFKEGAKI